MDNKLQILIVDDNLVNRMALRNLLMEFDTKIFEVDNGDKALEIIRNQQIDVIFMDLLMPVMDGITTTRYIREFERDDKRIKIIATSGSIIEEPEQYITKYQFDDVITKPLNSSKLKNCLEQWFFMTNIPLFENNYNSELIEKNLIIEFLGKLEELDLVEGFKYAHYSPACYMRIVKTSIKQMKDTIRTIGNLILDTNYKQIYFQLHLIKSVFFYIGAHDLAKVTSQFELLFMQDKDIVSNYKISEKRMQDFHIYIHRITVFNNELEQAVQAYYSSIKNDSLDNNETEGSIEEINRLIEKIVLHVYRFEYVEIMNGLKSLEQIVKTSSKQYIMQAIEATEEFNYDNVKAMLIDCWNEINE